MWKLRMFLERVLSERIRVRSLIQEYGNNVPKNVVPDCDNHLRHVDDRRIINAQPRKVLCRRQIGKPNK